MSMYDRESDCVDIDYGMICEFLGCIILVFGVWW